MIYKKFMRLLPLLFILISCTKEYESKYKKAYGYMEKNEIEALEKAVDSFDDAFQTAVASLHGEYDALLALGIKLVQNKMYLQAANVFDKAIAVEKKYASNYKNAADKFARAARLMPLRGQAWYRLGLCYGNYADILADQEERKAYIRKAEDTFKTGLNIDPENADLYYGLGILYIHIISRQYSPKSKKHINALKNARNYFEQTLKLEEVHIPALFGAAKAHYLLRSYKWSQDYLRKIQKYTPESSKPWQEAAKNLKIIREET